MADSDQWLEEARRRLDQCGYRAEDVDGVLKDVAHYNAMPVAGLMCELKAIALVLEQRGHGDISAGVHGMADFLGMRLGLWNDEEGEGKDDD